MPLFISDSLNPYFNLAVEEWLIREYGGGLPVWFLYRNKPCVVVGRFQNPWKECDLGWLHRNGLPLVRRPSGGGTVWHDLGNVNFCCVRGMKGFNRDLALKDIQARLLALNVPVEINARHDLVVVQSDGSTRKVSGSAYKQTKDHALHHGTLLLDGDLTKLGQSLSSQVQLLSTKSISSVRSKVMNLSEINPQLTPEFWLDSWGEATHLSENDDRFDTARWQDWHWVYGETPHFEWEFKVEEHEIKLTSHKGLIKELQWKNLGIEHQEWDAPLKVDTFIKLAAEKNIALETGRWLALIGN